MRITETSGLQFNVRRAFERRAINNRFPPDPAVRQSRRESQLRVSLRKARDEHLFSGMPQIAAGNEPSHHLRSAPVPEISVFIQLDGLASRELLGRN